MARAASPWPDFHVADLQSLSLAGSGERRDIRVPVRDRPEGFEAAYDAETLWYDAVRFGGDVVLVCPRLFNLTPLLSRLRHDGTQAAAPRRRTYRRHEIARLTIPREATRLRLTLGDWTGESGISADGTAHFAGLNASLHISRNNDLRWIADWAHYHISEHGLEAMLVMDNGSDAYPPEAILEALQPTGLKRAVVLNVPQPYGPTRGNVGGRKAGGGAKFLQPAMLNLARLRYLRLARAVLNMDLDELAWSHRGSVFDAAVASPLGLVSLAGRWRMPAPRSTAPYIHADHSHLRPGDKPCPPKYCLRPDGPLRWAGWDVHRLETALPVGRRPSPGMGYWHCRGITTNWKTYDRLGFTSVGPRDASTAAVLERVFPAPPRLPEPESRASLDPAPKEE